MSHILHKTEEWYDELGDCIFFHFHNFEEPPEVLCSNPLSSDFEQEYWTHYVTMDLNLIIEQADIQKCNHEWVSARNEVITSGEICLKCTAVRAEDK